MEGIITFDDFVKVDLRVGEIKDVEEIEGADKLWKLSVDLGEEKRTICAGIKEYYSKEELMNKKIIVVVNLAPRKMRGIESQGMLLAASDKEHKNVILISPEKDIENGSKIS
jgi:methionyl-tRNA synthetase